jgi:hypothetical protein
MFFESFGQELFWKILNFKNYFRWVKAELGYPLKNIKDSLLRIQIHLFSHFPYDLF